MTWALCPEVQTACQLRLPLSPRVHWHDVIASRGILKAPHTIEKDDFPFGEFTNKPMMRWE